MGTDIQTTTGPQTNEEWLKAQQQQKLQIAQLDMPKVARRAAELNAILETANAKIDRFGWNQMDRHIKDQLCADWCDVLSQYTLDEVRAGVRAVFAASKGTARSINEFQVQEQIRLAHRRFLASLPKEIPEPKREITDDEIARRRALSAELLGGAASSAVMPKPQSEAQTQANINAAKDQIETRIRSDVE